MENLLQFMSTIKCISGMIKMTSSFFNIVLPILGQLMGLCKHQWIVYTIIAACLFFGIGVIVQFVLEKVIYCIVYSIAFLFGRFVLNKLLDLYNCWKISNSNESNSNEY